MYIYCRSETLSCNDIVLVIGTEMKSQRRRWVFSLQSPSIEELRGKWLHNYYQKDQGNIYRSRKRRFHQFGCCTALLSEALPSAGRRPAAVAGPRAARMQRVMEDSKQRPVLLETTPQLYTMPPTAMSTAAQRCAAHCNSALICTSKTSGRSAQTSTAPSCAAKHIYISAL